MNLNSPVAAYVLMGIMITIPIWGAGIFYLSVKYLCGGREDKVKEYEDG